MNKCDFVSCLGTTQDRVYSRGTGPSNQSPPKPKAGEEKDIQRFWGTRSFGALEKDSTTFESVVQIRGGQKRITLIKTIFLSLVFFSLREHGHIAVSILSQG